MRRPSPRLALLGTLALLVLAGAAGPAAASPAPVSACPPCSHAFVAAAGAHGLDTDVSRSEATMRVHANGSATWVVRIEPTNRSVPDRLAANASLARSVARGSFGTRYGDGVEHDLEAVGVNGDAVVIRYRTLDVVEDGPLGTRVLTYFRDSPGAYVYTDLGADELTVVAPEGSTITRGFGSVDDDRMTATRLPRVRNGPFVVFTPEGSPAPGFLGWLAVVSSLIGVIARNLALFVLIPGGILLGANAAIRRFIDPATPRRAGVLGGLVAGVGGLLIVGTLRNEGISVMGITGNLLIGGTFGAVLLALGAGIAIPSIRRHVTAGRLVALPVAVAALVAVASTRTVGAGYLHTSLAASATIPPAVVAIGWLDARRRTGRARQLLAVTAAAVILGLVLFAPLREVGGGLFLLLPIAVTVLAALGAVASLPLYLLGAAGAHAEGTNPDADGSPGRPDRGATRED